MQAPPAASALPPTAPATPPEPPPTTGAITRPTAGIWRRILLAPGVELHYQPSSDAGWEARVARLIRAASRLLGGADDKP